MKQIAYGVCVEVDHVPPHTQSVFEENMTTQNEGGTSLQAPPSFRSKELRLRFLWIASLSLFLIVGLSLILVFPFLPNQVKLQVGQVSSSDVLAPRKITFESKSLTEEARRQAESRVVEVYDPPDPRVARQQNSQARQVLDYIDTVRQGTDIPSNEKVSALITVPDLDLSPEFVVQLLSLPEPAWRSVYSETLFVINRFMREPIREAGLADAVRVLPSAISPSFTEDEVSMVTGLARGFIHPNTFYNEKVTLARRTAAREQVQPIQRTIERGQVIVRAGEIVTARDLEALEALGLLQTQVRWSQIFGTLLFITIMTSTLGGYVLRRSPGFWMNGRHVMLFIFVVLLFAAAAKLTVPGHPLLPYVFPAAAASMILTVLLGPQFALSTTVLLGVIVALLSGSSLELFVYVVSGGLAAILNVWRVDRLTTFLWAGVWVVVAQLTTVTAFRLLTGMPWDMLTALQTTLAVAVNGALSASLTVAGFFVLGHLFGITTTLQLMDLARPTHPLLRQLQLKAPGTYHHSLVVSNMAEEAAQRIGADALMVRVAAYYHDVGKSIRPYFFVENQMDGVNAHDRLDPKTSAHIIIAHVADGIELAKKHKLPQSIRDFIAQHHGQRLATYFYRQAVNDSPNGNVVNPDDFRYPGPRPQSREAALLMLADSTEAAVRACRTTSATEIDQVVHRVIDERIVEGELDACDLTLRDIQQIREAFVCILQGAYHPRIMYPEEVKKPDEHKMGVDA